VFDFFFFYDFTAGEWLWEANPRFAHKNIQKK